MDQDVCGEPTAISAEWMTDALEAAGVARGAAVVRLTFDGLIGTGQMGRNARFTLEWDDPEGRPASVVGKFPSDDPTARATGFDKGSYAKEWSFYRDLHPTVHVRTPTVWVNRFDEAGKNFVIIMEDMRDSAQGDQFRGLTFDEAMLAVEQAVAFHAPLWGDASLMALETETGDEAVAKLSGYYGALVELSLARLGDLVDDEVRALARQFTPYVSQWAQGTGTPLTLAHMDYRPDNFLFGTTPDAPPLTIVDWATITFGLGTHDIAYMIGGGFEPAQRRRVERALVTRYCNLLNAAGVAYSEEDCWRDYRVSSLWGVLMSIIATMLAQETERGNRMLATMLRRHAHHAIDCDAISLLEALGTAEARGTLYEAVGGADGLRRLADAWHHRVIADEVVGHAFSHGFHPDHTERLAAYWAEALGGPAMYSERYGDETTVVKMHSGNGAHDEMDRNAIACFGLALADVGLSDDVALTQVLHDYFAWATTTTMSRYHESADDVPEGLRVPRWGWDGLQC